MDIKKLKINFDYLMVNSNKMIIIPHNYVDFDAIGSSLGLSLIAKNYGKKSRILIDDDINNLESNIKDIINNVKDNESIYNKEEFIKNYNYDDMYVLTDVNKKNLISVGDELDNPSKTIIIDHHHENENTINSNYKFIDSKISSASEAVVKLLSCYKIKIPNDIANYLLAGIYLDTNKLTKNVNSNTMNMVAKLLSSGANINYVLSLFKEDYYSDRKVQKLVSKIDMMNCSYAILLGDNEIIYSREELAKAADYALKFGFDAVFAVGKISEQIISVSARSISQIDVGKVMESLGGGGNHYSAATKLNDTTVDEVGKTLKKILYPDYIIS